MPRVPFHSRLNRVPPPWAPWRRDWRQVALLARVRLARNLPEFPFPRRASADDRLEVARRLLAVLPECPTFRGGETARIADLERFERLMLVERCLVSPELAEGGPGSAVVLGRGHRLTSLINEDDHLRVQALVPGADLRRAHELAAGAATEIAERVDLAMDAAHGFLTAAPTQAGAGWRGSVLLHLPGLALTGDLEAVVQALRQFGVSLTPVPGPGEEAHADLHQIAASAGPGTEVEAQLERLADLAQDVVRQEQAARLRAVRRDIIPLYDYVGRSYGILCFSHLLTAAEALGGISALVLGVRLGMLPGIAMDDLERLFLRVQPGHLRSGLARGQESGWLDMVRAQQVRQALGQPRN